jgi:hypothetical protein
MLFCWQDTVASLPHVALQCIKSFTLARNGLITAEMGRKERKRTKESRQAAAFILPFSSSFVSFG